VTLIGQCDCEDRFCITMTTTVRPGFRFSEGKLLVFTETEVMMIQSWPELSATKTKVGAKNWNPFVPVFRLLRPRRQLAGSIAPARGHD